VTESRSLLWRNRSSLPGLEGGFETERRLNRRLESEQILGIGQPSSKQGVRKEHTVEEKKLVNWGGEPS